MGRLEYALNEIHKNGRNTFWWRKRFYTHVLGRYFQRFEKPESPRVHEEEWDTLVILDACRYDLFKQVYSDYELEGRLERRRSLNSATPGFLRANFQEGQFHDTVYVTANAYVNLLLDEDTFHAVVPVWRDSWDDELQTVTPEAMESACRDALERYPNKRHIFHFIQPHEPFVGVEQLGRWESMGIREEALGRGELAAADGEPTSFARLAKGELTKETVWSAYRSNLERAMPAVRSLLEEIEGRTVITADHGEAFGEYAWPFPIRVFGHPLDVLIPSLTDVPWFVAERGERRDIVSEAPQKKEAVEERDATERLRMLGYVE